MKKLAIITTHPIQYNAPWFRLLTQNAKIIPKVFYTWSQSEIGKFDPGFGRSVEWDIPLLDGYDYTFVKNTSKSPGSHHFKGIINPTLIDEIKTWHPDAILLIGWSFQSHFKCLFYFHNKIPVLFRGDSTLLQKQGLIKKIARNLFLRFIYRHINKALYVGSANKAYYMTFGLRLKQLIFAPHSIDILRFSSNNDQLVKKAHEWRSQLGILEGTVTFLFAGKLEKVKNIALLINAFSSLKLENIHLIIAGQGDLENNLKLLSAGNDHIHFMPFQNQSKMPILYRLADAFILPSTSETWGLAVNEAMSCGKPVLVSDTCGCAKDLVVNGVNGYTFENNNQKDLEKKMIKFSSDKHLLKLMGQQSLNIIQSWSFSNTCLGIENAVLT